MALRAVEEWLSIVDKAQEFIAGTSTGLGGGSIDLSAIGGEIFICVIVFGFFAYYLIKAWQDSPKVFSSESI